MPLEKLQEYASKRNKEFNVIRKGNDTITYTHVSTGVFILDLALMGGIPENAVTTLVGYQHSGKTTLAYKIIANFQKKYDGSSEDRPKKYCIFVDVERGFNDVWAAANGVNTEELYVIHPTNAEEAVDYAAEAMEDEDVCLVVFDSIPALVGGKELEKSAEDHPGIGGVAMHANRMMRKVSHAIAKAHNLGQKRTMICINQWRVGISTGPTPAARTMPGGKYVRHYASVEVEIFNVDKDRKFAHDENGVQVADFNVHSFKIHKNRTGSSIVEGEFKLIRNSANPLGLGAIDDAFTVTTYSQKFGLVGGAGTGWWLADPETGEVEKYKSKGAIEELVRSDPELKAKLHYKALSIYRKSKGLSEHGW